MFLERDEFTIFFSKKCKFRSTLLKFLMKNTKIYIFFVFIAFYTIFIYKEINDALTERNLLTFDEDDFAEIKKRSKLGFQRTSFFKLIFFHGLFTFHRISSIYTILLPLEYNFFHLVFTHFNK